MSIASYFKIIFIVTDMNNGRYFDSINVNIYIQYSA